MIGFIIAVAIAGFLLWLVITYVPMPPVFRSVIIGVAVIGLILYALSYFGIWDGSFGGHYSHYR